MSHVKALAKKPAGAAAAPVRHAVAAARQTVADEAAPRAPFPLAAVSQDRNEPRAWRSQHGGHWHERPAAHGMGGEVAGHARAKANTRRIAGCGAFKANQC